MQTIALSFKASIEFAPLDGSNNYERLDYCQTVIRLLQVEKGVKMRQVRIMRYL
jgi:hypothetical protein